MTIHTTEIRVRYQETDSMGVVYYANYFVWLEIARTEYFRSEKISYKKIEEKGIFMMVANAECAYKLPARYDDIVSIETWIPGIKNSSMTFEHRLLIGQRLIARGSSTHVFTNKLGKPVRIPDEIRNIRI